MEENTNSNEFVTLEVENIPIKCKKYDLIKHSDYFKAMFEGNFAERTKKTIKLEDVSFIIMNKILRLLFEQDIQLIESVDDTLSVLQTSCMLQFSTVASICIEKLTHTLSPSNCIKIWLYAEQLSLGELYLKAKAMALGEFDVIKDSTILMDFELHWLCKYLGNTSLQCKNEMDVFQVAMKWWNENSETSSVEGYKEACKTDLLMTLLLCLDFKSISNSDIREIMLYPDIFKDDHIRKVLLYIIDMQSKGVSEYNELIEAKANLLINCKPRCCTELPCIFVQNNVYESSYNRRKHCFSVDDNTTVVVHHDKYKRKRYYTDIDRFDSSFTVAFYDEKTNQFTKLLSIPKQKCDGLVGYQVIGYKECIVLFGGEFSLGNGNWNKNIWTYNVNTENWQLKTKIPFVRRHFQSCVVKNCLYIIRGVGSFRVIQHNMFWYNFATDEWSNLIKLACDAAHIRYCSWNDDLYGINSIGQCVYIFSPNTCVWTTLSILDDQHLVTRFPSTYSIFSYKDRIYIQGNDLIEMKRVDQHFLVTKCTKINDIIFENVQSIVCGGIIYSLYTKSSSNIEEKDVIFEKYSITKVSDRLVFNDISKVSIFNNRVDCRCKLFTTLFGLHHYQLEAIDNFVNDFGF